MRTCPLRRAVDRDEARDLGFEPAKCLGGAGELEAHVGRGVVAGVGRDAAIFATAAFRQVHDTRDEAGVVDGLLDRHAGTGDRANITSSIDPPPGIIGQTFSAG